MSAVARFHVFFLFRHRLWLGGDGSRGHRFHCATTLRAAVAVILCCGPMPVVAQTHTWDGGSGTNNNWSDPANWDAAGAPAQPGTGVANLIFGGVLRLSPFAQAAYDVNSITFNSTAGAFLLGGTGPLTIRGGGVTNNDADVQTFSGVPLILAASQIWNATAGDLATSSASTVNLNGNVWTLSGANDFTLAGLISGVGGSIVKNGNGELVLSNSSSTISGGLQFNAGILSLNGANPLGTGSFTINGGTIRNTGGVAPVITNATTFGGNFTVGGSGNMTLAGPISLTADRTVNVTNTGLTTFSGAIAGVGGPRSLTKNGAGTLVFSGLAGTANTYGGLTIVNEGTLELSKAAGVISVPNILTIGDGFGAAGSARVLQTTAHQIADTGNVTLAPDGTWDLGGNAETVASISMTAGATIVNTAGPLSVLGSINISNGSATAEIGSDTGQLDFLGATRIVSVNDSPGVAIDFRIRNQIQNGSLTKNGAGTLELAGSLANTYTGTTLINAGRVHLSKATAVNAIAGNLVIGDGAGGVESDVLQILAAEQIADTANVDLASSGLLQVTAVESINNLNSAGGVLRFDSASELHVLGGISVTSSAQTSSAFESPGAVGLNLASAGGTTTVSVANGASAIDFDVNAPLIGGTLLKTGAGTMRLAGATNNTMSGTVINEGTLIAEKPSGVNAIAGNVTIGDNLGGIDADVLEMANHDQIAQTATERVIVNSSGLLDLGGFSDTVGILELNAGHVANGTISFGGSLVSNANAATARIDSNVDLVATTKVVTVNNGTAADDLDVTGAMQNGNFQKAGAGTLRLSGASANSANLLQVAAGTVVVDKPAGVNAVAGTSISLGDGVGGPQADVLRYGSSDDQLPDAMNVTVNSTGLLDLAGRSDTIRSLVFGGSGVVTTGTGTLTVTNSISSGTVPTMGSISGNLNLGGDTRPFSIGDSTLAVDFTVSAAMSNGTLQKQGIGTLALTGAALSSDISVDLLAGSLSASGLVTNAGRSFTQGTGSTFAGSLTNHGSFVYNGGTFNGQLTNQFFGAVMLNADFVAGNGLTNLGALTLNAGRTLTTNGGGFDNRGTLILAGGTLTTAGTFIYQNAGIVSGFGTISGLANFANFAGGSITVGGGNLILDSSFTALNFGAITVPSEVQLQLPGTGGLHNHGLISLAGGAVTGNGILTNRLGGEIRGGSSVSLRVINDGGLIRAAGPGVLVISDLTGGNINGGELRLDDGATMNVVSGFSTSGTVVLNGPNAHLLGGPVTNNGTIRGQGRISNVVQNSGTIRAETGTLTLAAAGDTNSATGRIEAGPGGQVLYAQGLATNPGQIALTGGAFDNNNFALANAGTIEGYGTLRSGGLTNTGTISVGGSLDVLGPVTNSGTVSTQTGTTVRFFGPVNGPGNYSGPGTVMFLNSFSPGASPALVNFGGTVMTSGGSNLIIELGGTVRGTAYDSLNIAGSATLDGRLDLELINGFLPMLGHTFDIVTAAGGVTGGFDVPGDLIGLDPTLRVDISYLPTLVRLAIRPSGDFNGDTTYNCADVNSLVAQIASGIDLPTFDLNGDALVDPTDLTSWLALAGAENLPSGNPYRPGDANLDGVVDGSDFGIWNSSKFTATAAWCSGDFSADGVVDGSDFGIWNSNKFTSSDSGIAVVPEPNVAVLIVLGLASLSGSVRRQA